MFMLLMIIKDLFVLFKVGVVICGFDEYFSFYKFIKVVSYFVKDFCLFIVINLDDRFLFN